VFNTLLIAFGHDGWFWFCACLSGPAAPYAGWVVTEAASQVSQAPPAEGTAAVWWARRQDAAPRLVGLLDPAERERWAGYRSDADRERFLVGCGLAKAAIAARTGQRPADVSLDRTCRQCGRPHGKPSVRPDGTPSGGLELSVAHSGDLVAVAVAMAPVGVDVEQLDGRRHELGGGDSASLARMVLAEPERAALAAVHPSGRARAFLVAWTRKEAVTKATGDGLRVPFGDVVVLGPDAGAPRLLAWPYPRDPGSVSLLDLEAAPGYVAALAVLGRCQEVLVRDGSALLALE
jgi:4'-phosphopantetheinyl transferase